MTSLAVCAGAPNRPRLHAAAGGRGARARDDRRRSRGGDHGVRHGAGVRRQRAPARARPLRRGARSDRADRDEGRHGATGRRLGAGRPGEGDPRRLRGEPRRARRPPDRPLPPARARPADAVAHVGARARPPRRRGPRAARGGGEREPAAARRGARARPRRGRPGRAEPLDDRALRGGVLERCAEAGVALVAHSPLGGVRRAASLARHEALAAVAAAHGATPAEVALAWLLGLSPLVVAIPGARRPETARSAARAAGLVLEDGEREASIARSGGPARFGPAQPRDDADVVLVMGIPGAGKSRVAEEYVARGYVRLNRDERGGSLTEIAEALGRPAGVGASGVVLDNTYLTRATAQPRDRDGGPARRPGAVRLARHTARAGTGQPGRAAARALRRAADPGGAEAALARAGRALAHLADACAPRARAAGAGRGAGRDRAGCVRREPASGLAGVFVAAAAWEHALEHGDTSAPHLVFDWSPDGASDALDAAAARLAAAVAGPVESALCPHPAGPPTCWCRPPLPGLPLAFARAHGVDPARSLLVGTGPAHRTLATALGARCVLV